MIHFCLEWLFWLGGFAFRASDVTGVMLIGFVTKMIMMLGMMPRIIFDRSIIDTLQRRDTSRSGHVNLKANSNPFKQKSLPHGKPPRLGSILTQNIACISLLNYARENKDVTWSQENNYHLQILDRGKKKKNNNNELYFKTHRPRGNFLKTHGCSGYSEDLKSKFL